MKHLLLIGCAILSLTACQKGPEAQSNEASNASAQGPVKGVDRTHKGASFPAISFLDEEDQDMDYAPLLGQPTLVNLWATWCAPCVKELPTLAKLAKQAPNGLYVAPISQDSAPRASVEAFLEQHKIDLPLYRDPKMALSGALGPDTVLPTSILYDAQGKEVWRYVGELDWTSPEALKLLSEAGAATTG
jgi:thiol-disulfide isomerase/thioredoxin